MSIIKNRQYMLRMLFWAALTLQLMCILGSKTYAADEVKVYINNDLLDFSKLGDKPQIYEGRTYVPIRTVAEALGFKLEWHKLEDKKASGSVNVNAYLSEGDIYFYVDEKTGEFVNKVADMAGEQVPVEFPAKYYLDTNADLSTFKLDFDAAEILEDYEKLTDEEKADIVFQKYSETSFSVYGNHTENKEEKDGEYLISTTTTAAEVSLEFDIEKGLTRAAFIITNTETEYVYGKLYDEEGFVASNYEASFLTSVVSTNKVTAQGEASFQYGDKVKVTLPEDLDTYLPLVLFN